MTSNSARPLAAVLPSVETLEGGGFTVFRPFPTANLDLLDPFLLLDEMAPVHHEPGKAIGAPPHPHRGFETVTLMLQGEMEHRDSVGNHGIIGPGDVQWMTAGDGIIHSEMPSTRMQTEGGVNHGLQLWVNLPRQLRRTQPRYQSIRNHDLATASGEQWSAEVVAGSLFGVTGPADSHTPIGYAHLRAEPGAQLRISVPASHTASVYAYDGQATVGEPGATLAARHLAIFERTEGDIALEVPVDAERSLGAIVLTGQPVGEPIARYGPFVMNTADEINEAINDFNSGRMGTIPAVGAA